MKEDKETKQPEAAPSSGTESAGSEPAAEKSPRKGLRIWLKDFTEISVETFTATGKDGKALTVTDKDGNPLTVTDNAGNDLTKTISIAEIREICQKIQKDIDDARDNHSIINCNEESETKPPTLFRDRSNGELAAEGYVGILIDQNDNQIVIGSRFDRGKERQWFLQYVFSKAFDANGKILKDMNPTGKYETTWDLLIVFLFLQRLQEALRKGIFRKYRQFLYNDSSVKGQIDIARYIRLDIPENGRIAYRTREYTPDNYYNILFLRALSEMEKKHPQMVKNQIARLPEVKKTLTILQNAIPEWNTVSIQKVLKNTEHRITHSVYRNYEQLRVISRIILRRLGFNVFDANREKAMGVVISMPTLWEKFLEKAVVEPAARQLGCTCRAQGRQTGRDGGIPILNGKREIKPDFYFKDKKLVLDAKYKNNWKETIDEDAKPWGDTKWDNVREDVFQIMAYMLSLKCNAGGVLCPYQPLKGAGNHDPNFCQEFYKPYKEEALSVYADDEEKEASSVFPDDSQPDDTHNRWFFRLPYLIPYYGDKDSYHYHDFAEEMQKSADEMKKVLEHHIRKIK